MIYTGYFSRVADAIQFLIAFASLLGFLGLIAGFVLLIIGGRFAKRYAVLLIVSGIMLVWMTGLYTGLRYFRV